MASLDSWAGRVGLERIDLIKVDVEGLELEVFQGGAALLERSLPVVYFEYLPEEGERGRRKVAAFEMLRSMGYEMQAVMLDGSTRPVSTPAECERLTRFSHDVIAVHGGAGATRGRR